MSDQQTLERPEVAEKVSYRFELRVKADFESGSRPAIDHIPAIESAIQALVASLFSDGNRVLQGLNDRFRLDRTNLRQLIPPPRGGIQIAPLDLWLRESLWGQKEPFVIGVWVFGYPFLPLQLVCHEITFEEGSLKSWLTGVAIGGTFIATVAMTPPAVDAYETFRVNQRLTTTYSQQQCVTDGEITLRASDLYAIAAPQFNYRALNLSDEEREVRVCQAQLAMSLGGFDAGPIDGIPGERTHRGLAALSQAHNLHTADVGDVSVQIALTKVMQRGLNEMKK